MFVQSIQAAHWLKQINWHGSVWNHSPLRISARIKLNSKLHYRINRTTIYAVHTGHASMAWIISYQMWYALMSYKNMCIVVRTGRCHSVELSKTFNITGHFRDSLPSQSHDWCKITSLLTPITWLILTTEHNYSNEQHETSTTQIISAYSQTTANDLRAWFKGHLCP